MKVLFDQGTPLPLRNHLSHSIDTVAELGWSALENGELLDRAESRGFDVMVTTDQNLRYQQNLAERKIRVVVLMSTSWLRIQRRIPAISEVLEESENDPYVEIPI